MTLTYGFYNSVAEDRTYDAIQMSRIFDGIIQDGVYATIGDKLMVLESTGMNVLVGTGRAWFDHSWTYNDSQISIAVPVASPLLPRIDVVYLEINSEVAVRANSVGLLAGTPATTPVPPTLTNTATIHQYALAHIHVAATTTSITQANIENKVGTGETPFVVCPLEFIGTDELLVQWDAQWTEWFDAIKDQLTEEAETNLQAQIWAAVGDIYPPLIDLLTLKTHNHTGLTSQVVLGGIAAGAVNTAALASGSVSESKIQNQAVTSAKLSSTVAGSGLQGGAGTALSVRVDNQSLEVVDDVVKVKTNGITQDHIQDKPMRMFYPATVLLPKGNAIVGEHATRGKYITISGTDDLQAIQGSFNLDNDISGNHLWFRVWWLPEGYGTVRWQISWHPLGGMFSTLTMGATGGIDVYPPDGVVYGDLIGPITVTNSMISLGSPICVLLSRDLSHGEDVNPADSYIYGISTERIATG